MSDSLVLPKRFQPFGFPIKSVPIYLVLLAMVLLNGFMGTACSTVQPPETLSNADISAVGISPVGGNGGNYAEKRNWESLQGVWGKRSLDTGISAELNDNNDDVYFAERRVPIPFSVNGDNANPILRYSLVYLKNGNPDDDAPLLDSHTSNNNNNNNNNNINNNHLKMQYDSEMNDVINDGNENLFGNEKRAWKTMNVGWGKRRSAPQWNKFRGAWGKREPGWNNLKGMWGKRSPMDWNRWNHGWGLRSFDGN